MCAFGCLEQAYHISGQRADMELELVSLKYVPFQWISWYRATNVSSRTQHLHINTAQVSVCCWDKW
jgi:hypothetical protein